MSKNCRAWDRPDYDEVFRKMTFTVQCDDNPEVFFNSEDMRILFDFAHCGPYRTGEYTAEKTFAGITHCICCTCTVTLLRSRLSVMLKLPFFESVTPVVNMET